MLPGEEKSEESGNPRIVIKNVPNILPIFSLLSLPFLLLVLVIAVQWLNNPNGNFFTNRAKGAVEEKSIYVFQQGLESYGGTTDTQLRSDRVNRNFGSNAILKVQADNWILSLLRFDVGSIPPSSRVQNARLELYLSKKNDRNRFQLGLYKLLRPWTESQANWKLAARETRWGSEGANEIGVDREEFPVTTAYVGTTRQWYFLDVTSAVQGWVSNPAANYGFVLRGNDANDTEFHFSSSNHSRSELRPRLVVTLESTGLLLSPTPITTSTPVTPLPTPTSSGLSPTPTTRPTSTPIPTARPTSTPAVFPTTVPGTWWKPTSDYPVHFHWQLTDDFVYPRDVVPYANVYDIDGEKATADTVAKLHALGAKVICYFDAGVWEDYRSDAGKFPGSAAHGVPYTGDPQYANVSIIGKSDAGWAGSYWMNTARVDILRPLMEWRIKNWCADKGFDAIEPDETENQDYYGSNVTGFAIPLATTIAYNKMIAELAHKYNLSAGLKGNTAELAEQVQYYDWNLNEECWQYGECANIRDTFIKANKMAISVDYKATPNCASANSMHLNSQKRDLNLVGPTSSQYSVMNCIPMTQNTW